LEGTALYLFTERLIGVAYIEFVEVYDDVEQSISIMLAVDNNGDGNPEDYIGWIDLASG
jgi:hypothetical protein